MGSKHLKIGLFDLHVINRGHPDMGVRIIGVRIDGQSFGAEWFMATATAFLTKSRKGSQERGPSALLWQELPAPAQVSSTLVASSNFAHSVQISGFDLFLTTSGPSPLGTVLGCAVQT